MKELEPSDLQRRRGQQWPGNARLLEALPDLGIDTAVIVAAIDAGRGDR